MTVNRPPRLATALQLVPCVGGLGYLLRRRWGDFGKTFGAVLALEAALAGAAAADLVPLAMAIGPLIFTVQALSALNLWRGAPIEP